jgi:hypothetical protein
MIFTSSTFPIKFPFSLFMLTTLFMELWMAWDFAISIIVSHYSGFMELEWNIEEDWRGWAQRVVGGIELKSRMSDNDRQADRKEEE